MPFPGDISLSVIPNPPVPGQIVRVRSRQYLVEETIPPSSPVDATLVRLAGLDDDAQGQSLDVLWEREVDPEVLTGEAWQNLASKGFDPPHLFSAYLHTLRWNCVTATDPHLFQSPFRAGIQILPYQLEPLRKALLLPRVNLFIADDVGLGKTIEAGLIARELLMRKKVRDIVIACPPSVLLQWKDELEARFGLTFEMLDKTYIARVRQERGYAVNPFTTHTRFLISQRLLIDERYAGPMRDWLGDFRAGALLILDEAHHAAPASGARYAIDSKITRAIRDLAPRFEHRLFLSATPHNGHSNSFSALLEILDPQRFCRGVPVRSKRLLDDVMVRRLKEDIREVAGGFPRRNAVQIDIDHLPEDAPELVLSKLLDEYRGLRDERMKNQTRKKQAAASLLISGLQQRLLSSIEAFARTLRVHRRTVQRQWEAQHPAGDPLEKRDDTALDLLARSVGSDDDRAELSEDDLAIEEETQFEAATRATTFFDPAATDLFAKEQNLLDRMTRIAEAMRALPDARIHKLVDWIREHMCPDLPPLGKESPLKTPPQWNDTRIIIFTEWDDTKRYLKEQLSAAIAETDQAEARIEIFHGPTPEFRREEIKRAFNGDPQKHPVRILIATDAAREGINLQTHCFNLFHFDVPWNPSRMEQRNGRIDRKLQPQPDVFCHYFVYKQRAEDRVLQTLVRKTETIKRELGSLSQVVESRLSYTLKMGIRHRAIEEITRKIEGENLDDTTRQTVQEELEEARERQNALHAQIDRLRNRLEDAKKWIGLDEAHFRAAISCALEMMGAESLKPVDGQNRFAFPALDQRDGADATWADTIDTLRMPRRRDQKLWEWRGESPIRPIVFQDPGAMDDSVVHLHLEHRVVQRLLGRFTAQGFVYHDLSRACFAQVQDAVPRVVLLGRLSLYGPGAARLHEVIVPVAARWVSPAQRKESLRPYAREAEARTLDLLENALLPGRQKTVAEAILQQLQKTGPQDVNELLSHLEDRCRQVAAEAAGSLHTRGEREARDMVAILEDQKKRVAEQARKTEDPQLSIAFDANEKRQLEANRRHWENRLTAIDGELKTEPARIREQYQIKASRIEPVGLVYLWPISG